MLEQHHIDWYWQDILHAKSSAEGDIQTARLLAKEVSCEGCDYCQYLDRHEKVLQETVTRLIIAVDSLTPGIRPKKVFGRAYGHGTAVYRGFITPEGDYVGMWTNMNHDKCWKEYHEQHGEKAFQLIKISGSFFTGRKALVIFSDRKAPPTDEQFDTLRELMIDAEGELYFRFVYDPSHPH